MAKSDARRTKGQAKPGKERGASGAVRAGEDAERDWAGSSMRLHGMAGAYGQSPPNSDRIIWDAYRGPIWQSTGERAFQSITGHHKPPTGRAESVSPVGMETGANSGRPIGEGAEAKGGERAAGVFDRWRDYEAIKELAKRIVWGGHHAGCLYWSSSGRIAGAETDDWGRQLLKCVYQQERKAAKRSNRKAGAALLIGLTLGLLISIAHQMVSRG